MSIQSQKQDIDYAAIKSNFENVSNCSDTFSYSMTSTLKTGVIAAPKKIEEESKHQMLSLPKPDALETSVHSARSNSSRRSRSSRQKEH
jgi:hypothetical protein